MLNRRAVFAAIDQQIAHGYAVMAGFAVLSVRIAGLREITLRFGCERGERAEESAEAKIRESLRPIDEVFRAGDETFAVVLPGLRTRNHALLAATRLIHAFEQPLTQETAPWHGRAIIGVVFFPEHGADADTLWRGAEAAADDAVHRGEQCAFHEMRESVDIRYQDLHDTIASNRLRTYFQPILSIADARLVGVESLTRWTSADRGEIRPSDFVTFAERSDLITALTRWSINSTFRHASALRGASPIKISLNLSPRAFVRAGLTEQLMDALRIWSVQPESVTVEVTETALVNDLNLTLGVLHRLRDEGIRIAIDDFGTGYASIAYLSKFPATDLKIDKSLVADIQGDTRVRKLVQSIVKLARHMDMVATGEGIEDEETLRLLIDMDCELGQGYHLGVPEPAGEFIARFNSTATVG
ncbi:MAG TPA: GGDEF domain-containing phosphodiesterase [Rudaea sp.]